MSGKAWRGFPADEHECGHPEAVALGDEHDCATCGRHWVARRVEDCVRPRMFKAMRLDPDHLGWFSSGATDDVTGAQIGAQRDEGDA